MRVGAFTWLVRFAVKLCRPTIVSRRTVHARIGPRLRDPIGVLLGSSRMWIRGSCRGGAEELMSSSPVAEGSLGECAGRRNPDGREGKEGEVGRESPQKT